jgi:hypothetical protein
MPNTLPQNPDDFVAAYVNPPSGYLYPPGEVAALIRIAWKAAQAQTFSHASETLEALAHALDPTRNTGDKLLDVYRVRELLASTPPDDNEKRQATS